MSNSCNRWMVLTQTLLPEDSDDCGYFGSCSDGGGCGSGGGNSIFGFGR